MERLWEKLGRGKMLRNGRFRKFIRTTSVFGFCLTARIVLTGCIW